jgi:cellulose synthase/poly-beta-1,6-N-acetylglucosamine synthase-like glycosyltransferase
VNGVEVVFWLSVLGVAYPYFGYPLLLWIMGAGRSGEGAAAASPLPGITMIIPVHNEERRIARKIANTAELQYPQDRLQVIFVSDGSTDRTAAIIREHELARATLIELPVRRGKAAALNAGLDAATAEIVVFSDASIQLNPDALVQIVRRFADPAVGCVSGEDPVVGSGGEALYGRYELFLRRLESSVHSIVGASGSFYAQRRALCEPFVEGMAPDFLSVLRTVARGYRAVSEPKAVGKMTSLPDPRHEFDRKVRTVLRGMTTAFAHRSLLNPLRSGVFAFELWSHKLLRWLAPLFLVALLASALALTMTPFYRFAFVAQVLFYLFALAALREWASIHRSLPGKIALYFSSVNAAILAGWWRYRRGVRQEIWTPSHR